MGLSGSLTVDLGWTETMQLRVAELSGAKSSDPALELFSRTLNLLWRCHPTGEDAQGFQRHKSKKGDHVIYLGYDAL